MAGEGQKSPKSGDVIIARSERQRDAYTIQIFQHAPQILYPTYELAFEKASRWAVTNDVAVWLTEDGTTFTTPHSPDEHLLRRIRGEFAEMPGLQLTVGQAERLCHLEPGACERLLQILVERRYLIRHPDGRYTRLTDDLRAPHRHLGNTKIDAPSMEPRQRKNQNDSKRNASSRSAR